MTIRYDTTRGDLLYANCRAITRNSFLLVFWSIVIVWVCYMALQDPKVSEHGFGYKVAFALVMAAFYYALFFAATFSVMAGMVLLRKNTGVLGEHRLSISAEGLIESTIHNESLNRWSAYHKTVSTKRYLMLYVTEGQFHIISKKRPLLEGDLAAFEAALNEKTKTA